MPYWNHRVVKQHLEDGTDWYSVRETHYNDDGTIYAYTKDPVDISGESIEEMREYCQWVMNCLDKEILVDGEVTFVNRDTDTDVIDDVMEQCAKNDDQWGGDSHDDSHSETDWMAFIDHQLYKLEEGYGLSQFRERMIKVAALAIQAVESYDRKNPCTT